jgi:hypothetical protein
MTPHDLAPGGVCLFCEEYIYLFDLGHDLGVSLDLRVMKAFAVDRLTHLDEVRCRAPEADYRVSWHHVTLKPIELVATLHD